MRKLLFAGLMILVFSVVSCTAFIDSFYYSTWQTKGGNKFRWPLTVTLELNEVDNTFKITTISEQISADDRKLPPLIEEGTFTVDKNKYYFVSNQKNTYDFQFTGTKYENNNKDYITLSRSLYRYFNSKNEIELDRLEYCDFYRIK